MPAGSLPDTRSVRASNMLRIAVHRPPDSDLALVIAVEDNLVKGAAGQAIQNMNLMFGLQETVGLTAPPVLPSRGSRRLARAAFMAPRASAIRNQRSPDGRAKASALVGSVVSVAPLCAPNGS